MKAPGAPKVQAPSRHGPLFRLFAFLFGSDDPEWKREQALRLLEKDLKRIRPRFYNPVQRTAEPALPRFFHELYRALGPAQVLLRDAQGSGALRLIVIEEALSPEQRALAERLTESALEERAKTTDSALLAEQVRQELRDFSEIFDREASRAIDLRFQNIQVLLDLVGFDYWLLLRKFDPGMPESDLTYKPTFHAMAAAGILEQLKDFLEVLPLVDPDEDWDSVLKVLEEYKGTEVVSRDAMRRVMQLVRDVLRTGVILGMVRHLEANPGYRPMLKAHRDRIVAPYIARLKNQTDLTIQRLAQSRAEQKTSELSSAVFGASEVSQLDNYCDDANGQFTGRLSGGYTHTTALAYLRAFLAITLTGELRDLVDLLVIRAKWIDNQPSQQMSEAFHELLKISEAISRFDQALGEEGELGARIHAALVRADKDRRALVDLRPVIAGANEQAKEMIGVALGHTVALARVLKVAYDDTARPHPEQVLNWRELQGGSSRDLRAFIASAYRRIYAFLQLMQQQH